MAEATQHSTSIRPILVKSRANLRWNQKIFGEEPTENFWGQKFSVGPSLDQRQNQRKIVAPNCTQWILDGKLLPIFGQGSSLMFIVFFFQPSSRLWQLLASAKQHHGRSIHSTEAACGQPATVSSSSRESRPAQSSELSAPSFSAVEAASRS